MCWEETRLADKRRETTYFYEEGTSIFERALVAGHKRLNKVGGDSDRKTTTSQVHGSFTKRNERGSYGLVCDENLWSFAIMSKVLPTISMFPSGRKKITQGRKLRQLHERDQRLH